MNEKEILAIFKKDQGEAYFITGFNIEHPAILELNSLGYYVTVSGVDEILGEFITQYNWLKSYGMSSPEQDESWLEFDVSKYTDLKQFLSFNNTITVRVPVLIDWGELTVYPNIE